MTLVGKQILQIFSVAVIVLSIIGYAYIIIKSLE